MVLKRIPCVLALLLSSIALPVLAQSTEILNADFNVVILVQVLGLSSVAIAVHIFLGHFKQRLIAIAHRRTGTQSTDTEVHAPLDLFLRLLIGAARIGLWSGVVLYIANLFPATSRWSTQAIQELIASFTTPVLSLGNRTYSIINLLILVALLFGILILAGVFTNLLRTRVLHRAGINRGLQEVIATLTKYAVIAIATIVVLQIWGLDLSSLAIFASALSVGIGFGLQDIAKNFGSGLVLVFERPIQVGDFVEVGEFKGTVERIGARSTEIKTLDQVSIIVPNSRFLANEVINWSHHNPVSRLHIPVGVAYHAHPEQVEAVLIEVAQSHPEVLKSPPPQVFFKGFGASALDFELLIWTSVPSRQFFLKSDLNFRIFAAFQERHIDIPFPQQDIHVRSIHVAPELTSTLQNLAPPANDT
jgi:potassium-dependent mechanosensitive channel